MAESATPENDSNIPNSYGIREGVDGSTVIDDAELRSMSNEALFIMTMTGNKPAVDEWVRRYEEIRNKQKESASEGGQ
jgi:uncharacterized protein (UPF0303 family)